MFHLDVPLPERKLSVTKLIMSSISDKGKKQDIRDKSCISLAFELSVMVTRQPQGLLVFLVCIREKRILTNQLTSDNQVESDRKMQCIHTTSHVKIWPAAYHLSDAYCYCKMIRCYNPVAGKMSQKIYFSCFLGTKISESQAYVFNFKSAAPELI